MSYFKVVFGIGENQGYCVLKAASFFQAFSYAYNNYRELQSVSIINAPSKIARQNAKEI